jgi:hypothetical protein
MIEVEPRICPEIGKAARGSALRAKYVLQVREDPFRKRGKQAAEQISDAYLIRSPWKLLYTRTFCVCFSLLAGEKRGAVCHHVWPLCGPVITLLLFAMLYLAASFCRTKTA